MKTSVEELAGLIGLYAGAGDYGATEGRGVRKAIIRRIERIPAVSDADWLRLEKPQERSQVLAHTASVRELSERRRPGSLPLSCDDPGVMHLLARLTSILANTIEFGPMVIADDLTDLEAARMCATRGLVKTVCDLYDRPLELKEAGNLTRFLEEYIEVISPRSAQV